MLLSIVAFLPPGRLPYPPGSRFSDATLAHWPNAFFLRRSVWHFGQWPFWRPTEMLGAPFAANPLSKVWYPPQWLVLLPGLPVTLALNLLVYAHLVLAALGVLAWTRAESLSDPAGAFAALAYAFTPKTIAHLGAGHLDLVYAMAWAPWLLWAVRRGRDKPWLEGGVAFGVLGALLALADVRLGAYALAVGGLYALSLRWRARALGAAAIVFLLLMAVYLVPLLALRASLTRAAITPAEAAQFSLPPGYLLGLLLPNSGGFHELMTYLSLPVLVLAPLALRVRVKTAGVLWVAVLLAVLFALGEHTPLYPALVRVVPPLTWFRVPSRAWFVVALAMTGLSAFGAQALLDGGLGRAGRLAALALAVAGFAIAVGALILGQPPLVWAGLALLGTGGALLLSLWPGAGVRWSLAALGVVLVVSLLALGTTLVEGRREADAFGPLPDPIGPGRVYSPSFTVLPHQAEQGGLLTLHGVNPYQLAWSAEAIDAAAGVTGDGYSITAPRLPPDSEDPATALRDSHPNVGLLAALGVERVVTAYPIDAAGLTLLDVDTPPFIYRVDDARLLAYLVEAGTNPTMALDAMPPANGHVEVTMLTPNKVVVKVEASGDALLVLTQAWAPGWRARVGGHAAEVRRVGGVVQGVMVNAGATHVELVYRPVADFVGLAISGGTALLLAAWKLVRWHKSR